MIGAKFQNIDPNFNRISILLLKTSMNNLFPQKIIFTNKNINKIEYKDE